MYIHYYRIVSRAIHIRLSREIHIICTYTIMYIHYYRTVSRVSRAIHIDVFRSVYVNDARHYLKKKIRAPLWGGYD